MSSFTNAKPDRGTNVHVNHEYPLASGTQCQKNKQTVSNDHDLREQLSDNQKAAAVHTPEVKTASERAVTLPSDLSRTTGYGTEKGDGRGRHAEASSSVDPHSGIRYGEVLGEDGSSQHGGHHNTLPERASATETDAARHVIGDRSRSDDDHSDDCDTTLQQTLELADARTKAKYLKIWTERKRSAAKDT